VADLLRRGPAPRPGKAADPPREAPPAGAGKD